MCKYDKEGFTGDPYITYRLKYERNILEVHSKTLNPESMKIKAKASAQYDITRFSQKSKKSKLRSFSTLFIARSIRNLVNSGWGICAICYQAAYPWIPEYAIGANSAQY